MSEGSRVEVGALIGETYRITKKLGQGGMGEVWKAEHARLPGLQVAIKFLFGGEVRPEDFSRFQREAHIMAALHHPHITRVTDLNMLPDGTPYIVLEFLEGEPLSERLKRGPLALRDVAQLLSQVGSALQATHAKNIIHRDLKPDNIFLCVNEGEDTPLAKVLDFGVSKVRHHDARLTQHNQGFLGTPQYMSPEQALGEDDVDQAADQFALAIISYEMISGVLPFDGDQVIQIATKIVQRDPRPLRELAPHLSPQAEAVIHKALSKQKADRYESCQAFVSALVSALTQAGATVDEDEWAQDNATEIVTGDEFTTPEAIKAPTTAYPSTEDDLTVPVHLNAQLRADLLATMPPKLSLTSDPSLLQTVPLSPILDEPSQQQATLQITPDQLPWHHHSPPSSQEPTSRHQEYRQSYAAEEREAATSVNLSVPVGGEGDDEEEVDYAEDAYTAISDPLLQAQMNDAVRYEVSPPSKERSNKLLLRLMWGALLSAMLGAAWFFSR